MKLNSRGHMITGILIMSTRGDPAGSFYFRYYIKIQTSSCMTHDWRPTSASGWGEGGEGVYSQSYMALLVVAPVKNTRAWQRQRMFEDVSVTERLLQVGERSMKNNAGTFMLICRSSTRNYIACSFAQRNVWWSCAGRPPLQQPGQICRRA